MEVGGGEGPGSAIEVLCGLMRRYRDNPRLLEDSICGLSNLAFVSDDIQHRIGRVCMGEVCRACTRFSGDAYLFQMTLRAVGNLTRSDENIARAVSSGCMRGMVDGMARHRDNVEVVKLCADVLGNMASVDDRKLARDEGLAILRTCLLEAQAEDAADAAAAGGAADGAAGGASSAAATAASVALVDAAENVKHAVCGLIYEGGGAHALVAAMLTHAARPELVSSCLRALHYIASSPALMARLVEQERLVEHVVFVMQANDASPDVLRRGARILGLVAGEPRLVFRVVDAGAAPMLLTAVENLPESREVTFLCFMLLTLLRSPAVSTAVRELRAVETAAACFRKAVAAGDVEFYAMLLELFLSLASEHDLAHDLADQLGGDLAKLLLGMAEEGAHINPDADQVTLFSYLLSTVAAIVKAGPDAAEKLLEAGLVGCLSSIIKIVLRVAKGMPGISPAAPQMLLHKDARRAVVHALSVFADLVRPPAPADEEQSEFVLDTEAASAIIGGGGALTIEAALCAYREIPDATRPDGRLYDANTCKVAVAVLRDLVECGWKANVELDPPAAQAPLSPMAASASAAASSTSAAAPATKAAAPPAAAAAAALAAQTGANRSYEPAAAEVAVLVAGSRPCSLWDASGKGRGASVCISADREWVVVTPDAKDKGGEPLEVPCDAVAAVALGLPKGYAKKIFGKNASSSRSVCVEDHKGAVLLHLELASEGDRELVAKALAGVCKAPLRR